MKFHCIDDFELGRPLGIGRFGQVWLAKHIEKGFICAIKIISLDSFKNHADVKNIRREIEVHLNLSHPNILNMYGFFFDSLKLYCVLEYAGKGDLWRELNSQTKFSESKTSKYILQIISAFEYMHSKSIIHRDLKPENILIGCDDKLKLCDFGWSVFNKDKKRLTFCGTAEYLSPEMCENKNYDDKVDIWCLGILCYELCSGSTPYSGTSSLKMTKYKILNEKIEFPDYFNAEIIDFIERCCDKDPEKRMSIEEAKNHKFIKMYNKEEYR